jgi:hypothetical protein
VQGNRVENLSQPADFTVSPVDDRDELNVGPDRRTVNSATRADDLSLIGRLMKTPLDVSMAMSVLVVISANRVLPQTAPAQPKQTRACTTRLKILYTELEIVQGTGIEKVSTNLIARRAGVKVASLYKYFPNKDDILKRLALDFSHKQTTLICEYLRGTLLSTPLEALCHGLVDALVEGTRSDRALVQLQRALTVIPELHEAYRLSNDDIGEAMRPFLKR